MSKYVAAGNLYGSAKITRNPYELAKPIPIQRDALYELIVQKAVNRNFIIANTDIFNDKFLIDLLILDDEKNVSLMPISNTFYLESKSYLWRVDKYESTSTN